jgi:hypothetical protein
MRERISRTMRSSLGGSGMDSTWTFTLPGASSAKGGLKLAIGALQPEHAARPLVDAEQCRPQALVLWLLRA